MFSSSPSISSIVLFDCEYVEQCWRCSETCFSGLRINLRYKFDLPEEKAYICLCGKHTLKALKWNFIDLPLNRVDFLFTQKYQSKRDDLITQVRKMEFFTPQSLKDRFEQGDIDYWHGNLLANQGIKSGKIQISKVIEAGNRIQAIIFENSDKTFFVRYAYPSYIELGEWEWKLEDANLVIFSSNFKDAISIAIVELMNRLGRPVVNLKQ